MTQPRVLTPYTEFAPGDAGVMDFRPRPSALHPSIAGPQAPTEVTEAPQAPTEVTEAPQAPTEVTEAPQAPTEVTEADARVLAETFSL
jgi:hypothetical protein